MSTNGYHQCREEENKLDSQESFSKENIYFSKARDTKGLINCDQVHPEIPVTAVVPITSGYDGVSVTSL